MNLSPIPPPEPPIGYVLQPMGRVHSPNISRTPSPNIRPTTAGLLQFPSPAHLYDQQQQQQLIFKDELMSRQNELSRASSLGGQRQAGELSIDEKIKLRRDHELKSQRNGKTDNQLSVTDRLLTDCNMRQQDKRPFAYSPDVNDPNNRGKLDLSQIKSPAMRRRLLANMDSESGDYDEINDDNPSEQRQQVELVAPRVCKPAVAPRPKRMQADASNYGSGGEAHKSSIVQFREPPKFYCTTTTSSNHTARNQDNNNNNNSADLDLEIAQSLNSLTLLADNLDKQWANAPQLTTFQPRPSSHHQQVAAFNDSYTKTHHYGEQRKTSFYQTLPSGQMPVHNFVDGYCPSSLYTGQLGSTNSTCAPLAAVKQHQYESSPMSATRHNENRGVERKLDWQRCTSDGKNSSAPLRQASNGTFSARPAEHRHDVNASQVPPHLSPYWRQQRAQQLRQMTSQLQREVERLDLVDLSRF